MTIRTAAIIGVVVIAALHGSADVAAQRTTRGTIAGVVVSTDATPQPIPRAVVMLTGNGIRDNLSVVGDEAGRFRFVDVEPGRYHNLFTGERFECQGTLRLAELFAHLPLALLWREPT